MPKADIGFSRLAFGEQGGFGKRRPALMNAMLEKERSAVQGVMMRSLSDAAFREREDGGDVYGRGRDGWEHGLIRGVTGLSSNSRALSALAEVQPRHVGLLLSVALVGTRAGEEGC